MVLGFLPSATEAELLPRDIKVYRDHAFIVSEAEGHGLQVVELMRLPDVVEVAHYSDFGNAHNIAINEASGYAYVVGAGRDGQDRCTSGAIRGGLHVINIQEPTVPTFAGCFYEDGYTHDAQCVSYPAASAYPNQEICFAFNLDTITIVNVTDKSEMEMMARVSYEGFGLVHQGWISEDRRFLLQDDEFDELDSGVNTTTYVWNIEDLSAPRLVSTYTHDTAATDHNLYIRGPYTYEANYRAGLRILDTRDVFNIAEVGFFDIYPEDDAPGFDGAWTAYPYLPSGTLLVSGIEQGLFLLRHTGTEVWLPLVSR